MIASKMIRMLQTAVWVTTPERAWQAIKENDPSDLTDFEFCAIALAVVGEWSNLPGLLLRGTDVKHRWDFISENDLRSIQDLILGRTPGNAVSKACSKMAREHATQRDKGGKPYIYHTLAVALEILKADGTEEEVSAGMLHDVVEDTPTTSDSLRHVIGLSETTVDAVVSVTKVEGEARADYIDRLAKNKTGRRVKIADLRNNMDITRLKNRGSLTEKDLQRIKVYGEEYDFLVGGQVGV